jgi:hypothetical protein
MGIKCGTLCMFAGERSEKMSGKWRHTLQMVQSLYSGQRNYRWLTFKSLLVRCCNSSFNIQLYALPTLYLCFVFVWEQTATCVTYSINWLVFITEMESVYSAVRTGYLNEAVCAYATYSINWLVFITEMKSVYSAVRTGSLNEAVCAPSFKG